MRILVALAAAALSWAAAAGEACAQAKEDPLCSEKTRSLDERINACTRFIDRTPLVYNTGPYVADAYDTRAIARVGKADCPRAIDDVNVAIRYTALYKEPSVRKRHYRFHITAAYVHLNCAGDFDAALAVLERGPG